jgi:hypothetical protein
LFQALRQKDEEITALEEALKASHGIPSCPLHAGNNQNDIANETKTPTTVEMARQASNESQSSGIYDSSNGPSSPESISHILTPMTPPTETAKRLEPQSHLGLAADTTGELDAARASLACGRAASADELHLRQLDELMR